MCSKLLFFLYRKVIYDLARRNIINAMIFLVLFLYLFLIFQTENISKREKNKALTGTGNQKQKEEIVRENKGRRKEKMEELFLF